MPTLGVQHCLREFNQRIQDSVLLVSEAYTYRVIKAKENLRFIGARRVELFAGVALFRIHMAWETLLEDVFLRYMCGARTASGFCPILLLPPKATVSIAMSDLLGPRFRYLTWDPSHTLTRATIHFDHGEPFSTAINAISLTLNDILSVRNCFVHRSGAAAADFQSVIITAFGYLPRGISPGRFLLMRVPSAGGLKYLEYYANLLLGAGMSIVP